LASVTTAKGKTPIYKKTVTFHAFSFVRQVHLLCNDSIWSVFSWQNVLVLWRQMTIHCLEIMMHCDVGNAWVTMWFCTLFQHWTFH